MRAPEPLLTPPRGGGDIGDYGLRDFAIKWLAQQADLAEIGHYREANRSLTEDGDHRRRVVLYGDSITEFWSNADELSGPGWQTVNRGIAGQNTTQMLLRFEDDVVALDPVAVVLLGGTNDLRCYAGPPAAIGASALERIARNVTAMADIAKGRGIEVLIGTLPPVGLRPDVFRDPGAVAMVNDWLSRFALSRGLALIDYHDALSDGTGCLSPALSDDGVHPNEPAYERMMTVLRKALAAARLSGCG